MPNTYPRINRLPAVRMNVDDLMKRPMAEIQKYESDVVPFFQPCPEDESSIVLFKDGKKRILLWQAYKQGFRQALTEAPGTFYAVANFNLKNLEPNWCYQRFNLFDMKIARHLHKKHWCRVPSSERAQWVAVPEQATYLHYNMIWNVPIQHQEKFYLDAPDIWRSVIPPGQFHLQVIGEEDGEATAVRNYTGKTFNPRWTIDNTITSTELRRKN